LTVLVIVCLLIVQAYCDLSLPRYTAAIVDVGIMQGGIEDAVPDEIRKTTLDDLEHLMTAGGEKDAVIKYYAPKSGDADVFGLTLSRSDKSDEDAIDLLDKAFTVPMLIMSSGKIPEGQVGALTPEQVSEIRKQADEQIEKLGDMAGTAATAFVKSEYEAIGLDLNKIQMDYMKHTGWTMILFTLLSAFAAIMTCLLASYRAAYISKDLRRGMFFRILSFSGREMDTFSTASLITRSTNDIQQVQMAMVMALRMALLAPIMATGGIINVVKTHTDMGWIIIAAVGALIALFGTLLIVAMPKFNIMQKLVDRLNLVSREILTGLPVIRAFCKEDYEKKRFEKANLDMKKTQLFVNRAMSFMFPVMMFLMNIISVGIVWFGAKEIDLGQIQVGDMMAFITYTMQIVMSFTFLSMIAIILPRANIAANRIHDVLITEPSITDKPDSELVHRPANEWSGHVVFDDVSFRYPDADDDILEHISFSAEPGETTAIIGSTGSGKSSLVNLIPRLFDVTAGSVKIDGVDIRDLSQHDLRALLGVVPQKGVLFSGDIRSNIKFSNEDADDEEMERAAKIAQAEDFIAEKEGGYGSAISQGGSNVSGGQKQRISIARAIEKDPKVYIFDDSFSALDYKTDTKLRKALSKNVKDSTILIVAQRIATILRADKIVVLDEGQIAGIGTHKELMENCDVYREIAISQLNEEELAS
jgi:ATP-binding cassette subfamily B protein